MLSSRYAHVVLTAEHLAVRQALSTMIEWLRAARERGAPYDLPRLIDLLAFLHSFTGSVHQKKEEALFAALRRRDTLFAATIQTIQQLQESSRAQRGELDRRASSLESGEAEALAGFEEAARRYVHSVNQHLALEEELLAEALRLLTDQDWFNLAVLYRESSYPAKMVYEQAAASMSWHGGRVLPTRVMRAALTAA